jgi:hypothetical protein
LPHPFAFFLAKGRETTKLKVTYAVSDLGWLSSLLVKPIEPAVSFLSKLDLKAHCRHYTLKRDRL